MKKLFFTALVAVVAVGGAYAQKYSTGPNGTGTKFNCQSFQAPSCATAAPTQFPYIIPSTTPVTETPSDYDRQYQIVN